VGKSETQAILTAQWEKQSLVLSSPKRLNISIWQNSF